MIPLGHPVMRRELVSPGRREPLGEADTVENVDPEDPEFITQPRKQLEAVQATVEFAEVRSTTE